MPNSDAVSWPQCHNTQTLWSSLPPTSIQAVSGKHPAIDEDQIILFCICFRFLKFFLFQYSAPQKTIHLNKKAVEFQLSADDRGSAEFQAELRNCRRILGKNFGTNCKPQFAAFFVSLEAHRKLREHSAALHWRRR